MLDTMKAQVVVEQPQSCQLVTQRRTVVTVLLVGTLQKVDTAAVSSYCVGNDVIEVVVKSSTNNRMLGRQMILVTDQV